MKLILYSNPDNGVLEKLKKEIFPKNKKIVFGYMPADGSDPKQEFTPFWQDLAKKHGAEFLYINNSKKPTKKEREQFEKINSLTITGGNVYALLDNLRNSGYDALISNLAAKDDFIYSGFSAGAMIVTPDIRAAGKEYGWSFGYDENRVGISDTKSLGFIDFEILPHYDQDKDKEKLEEYKKRYNVNIKPITDSEYLILVK